MVMVLGNVLIDGRPVDDEDASVPVTDVAVLRGYGCFEAVRSYDGVLFRLEEHLQRLERSAAAMDIPLPAVGAIEEWARRAGRAGDGVVRIIVTGGLDADNLGHRSRVIVFAHTVPPRPDFVRLIELTAPWHPAGVGSELAGVKSLSYAPNLAAARRAKAAGFDDALLIDVDTTILELPNASIGWVIDGVIETPSLDLGILRSVTRHAMLEVAAEHAIPVVEGRFPSARLHSADEAFMMSTTKEITPVTSVGKRDFAIGPVTRSLAASFRELVEFETAPHRNA